MRCQHCQSHDALEQDGHPVLLHLFEDISGYYCAECTVLLQQPRNAALRQSIAERAPAVTDEQLAAMPDQMLKYTMCLPIPQMVTDLKL
jgi:hypothetical protein